MTATSAAAGLLLVDKPAGPTSHDIVERVRRLYGTRRVGHAGTLDPAATGLLLVMLGEATRLSEYLLTADKVYTGVIRLGIRTTTGDCQGEILQRRAYAVSESDLERARRRLVGTIEQVPPMYAAIKVGGRRLHELARLGLVAARKPREVTISELQLELRAAGDFPEVAFTVRCSKGTYIRSLAEDLGGLLGGGACLASLRRLSSGPWHVAKAHSVADLESLDLSGRLRLLLPLARMLPELPEIGLDTARCRLVADGRAIEMPAAAVKIPIGGGPVRLIAPGGALAAVATASEPDEDGLIRLRPRKVFASCRPGR